MILGENKLLIAFSCAETILNEIEIDNACISNLLILQCFLQLNNKELWNYGGNEDDADNLVEKPTIFNIVNKL